MLLLLLLFSCCSSCACCSCCCCCCCSCCCCCGCCSCNCFFVRLPTLALASLNTATQHKLGPLQQQPAHTHTHTHTHTESHRQKMEPAKAAKMLSLKMAVKHTRKPSKAVFNIVKPCKAEQKIRGCIMHKASKGPAGSMHCMVSFAMGCCQSPAVYCLQSASSQTGRKSEKTSKETSSSAKTQDFLLYFRFCCKPSSPQHFGMSSDK